MNTTFIVGLIGSIILVIGAAWPIEKKVKHPVKSIKNWLFAIGGLFMLTYSVLGYLDGGSIFFIFLQLLVLVSSIMMMLNCKDLVDIIVISIMGLVLIVVSLYLFESYNTVFFIFGLTGIGLGYSLKMGSIQRSAALTSGSLLIALFSYIELNWIFFWLNVFFAIFSGYYLILGFISKYHLTKK